MFGQKAKSNYYYDSFPKLCHYSLECADYILDYMKNFDHSKLEQTKVNVHLIEHRADDEKHIVMEKLTQEFMTTIDREDIIMLLRMIDDITDAVEEVSLKLYIYDYHELPPDSIEFMALIRECIAKTEECLKHFPDFLTNNAMKPYIAEVVRLEEESDEYYIRDVHSLYINCTDGFARHRGEAIYTMLEETADRCREVCKYVEIIIYKNL
jgi:uncharacterized protein